MPEKQVLPSEIPANGPKVRKITPVDLDGIAQLLAKRLTESEACYVLGLKPDTWFKWKCRGDNASRFESVLSRARGLQIEAHMRNIETFEQKDWRASEALLRIKDPERFSDKRGDINVKVSVFSPQTMAEAAKRVYGQEPKQIEVSEVKALPAPATGDAA